MAPAESLEALAEVGREEAVDEGVGRRVEGGEGLDEGGHCLTCLVLGDQAVHLQLNKCNRRCHFIDTRFFFFRQAQTTPF